METLPFYPRNISKIAKQALNPKLSTLPLYNRYKNAMRSAKELASPTYSAKVAAQEAADSWLDEVELEQVYCGFGAEENDHRKCSSDDELMSDSHSEYDDEDEDMTAGVIFSRDQFAFRQPATWRGRNLDWNEGSDGAYM